MSFDVMAAACMSLASGIFSQHAQHYTMSIQLRVRPSNCCPWDTDQQFPSPVTKDDLGNMLAARPQSTN